MQCNTVLNLNDITYYDSNLTLLLLWW